MQNQETITLNEEALSDEEAFQITKLDNASGIPNMSKHRS